MIVTVNGMPQRFEESCRTLADLLARPEWAGKLVIVELNGELAGREAYGDTLLSEGDRVELVHFVGGG
ncbi:MULTISPECIES: sulfur carrier protein ThiS [unclassified Paenibacillus]|uniref:sulfur carrier protein ThiS n=1 Tax=unclassified Paenibacillus TaxID=185978 RepID=UPI0003E2198D|nr:MULTISPECIES: sulfur carrier protein ThiS [unclassified Paenibacillus]ETT47371.1 thiazole biosynthesis protein ThiS [Paenibacillus sp. FSL R7-269]OMF98838.1 thiamine biosynthesis protein ThiS [Paenibacillus sp. FSL R7-0337]